MSPFFVLLASCGVFFCNTVIPSIDFQTAEACTEFVQAYKRSSSAVATCFDRSTGKIIIDSKGRK